MLKRIQFRLADWLNPVMLKFFYSNCRHRMLHILLIFGIIYANSFVEIYYKLVFGEVLDTVATKKEDAFKSI